MATASQITQPKGRRVPSRKYKGNESTAAMVDKGKKGLN